MAGGNDQTTFAAKLRSLLDEKDISVRQLARRYDPDALDSARPYLHKLLAGKHVPSLKTRRRIARALDMPADYFESDDEEPEDGEGATAVVAA